MTPDVAAGLYTWHTINEDPRRWANFEAIQLSHMRIVRVDHGTIHTNGIKERAIETITFSIDVDGVVRQSKSVHA